MKTCLTHRPGTAPAPECPLKETLSTDLGMDRILSSMAAGDEVVEAVCRDLLFRPLTDRAALLYRQDALRDSLKNADTVRALYTVCVDSEKRRKNSWHSIAPSLSATAAFSGAVGFLQMDLEQLRRLRKTGESKGKHFASEAFRNLFAMLSAELDDAWLREAEMCLDELGDRGSTLIEASLGPALEGVNYRFCRRPQSREEKKLWQKTPAYRLSTRDETGMEDMSRRTDRALWETAEVLCRASAHMSGFLADLRRELAFYVGCLNLAEEARRLGLPLSVPEMTENRRAWDDLVDLSMALSNRLRPVGNAGETCGVRLTVVTGANQGGKSTFLRSFGQAQLMAQAGMPAAAKAFAMPPASALFTHFRREEDDALQSGKLDEELERMSTIVDELKPGSLLLFNESFAATNEREGSAIAREITDALLAHGMEAVTVTHLYTFAAAYLDRPDAAFFRAERQEDGTRTCRIVEGRPTETAYGEDLYRKIFLDGGRK